VRFWIAQRPQSVRCREHEVDREQRKVRSYPGARSLDPRTDVPAPGSDLARDQREEALGIGVALDQPAVIAELSLECGQVLDHAVVGEQPPVLLERVRVTQIERARGGEADVREEGPRADLARLAPELRVAVSGDRLLADVRRAVTLEPAQTSPVRLTMALHRQAVWRVEQPEHGPGGLAPSAHPEQATHRQAESRRPVYAVPGWLGCPTPGHGARHRTSWHSLIARTSWRSPGSKWIRLGADSVRSLAPALTSSWPRVTNTSACSCTWCSCRHSPWGSSSAITRLASSSERRICGW
jgi:hypothetical protein